ncbi:MAG: hypothetical protein HYU67_08595 [Flavobacteriia bacterium]|nr:hypothetical protein [Flavobacteriia bacterium]
MFRILVLVLFLNNNWLLSQKHLDNTYKCRIECNNNKEIEKCILDSIPKISIFIHSRENEYFTEADTLKRDYINFDKVKYTFDFLLNLKQTDYTISFNLNQVYLTAINDVKFLIIQGFNSFQIGSDQQTFFIILKLNSNKIEPVSAYLYDSADEPQNIKLSKRKNTIILKHKKLKLL